MSFVRGSFGIFACLVLASAFSVPFVIGFVLMDSFTSSYDNSGSGAPFRSCTETSTSCGGPDILGAAVLTVLLSVAVLLPGLVGVAVGDFVRSVRAFWSFTVATLSIYTVTAFVLLTSA